MPPEFNKIEGPAAKLDKFDDKNGNHPLHPSFRLFCVATERDVKTRRIQLGCARLLSDNVLDGQIIFKNPGLKLALQSCRQ